MAIQALSAQNVCDAIQTRGGTDIKIKIRSGIGYPINFKYGTGLFKTLPESICITGEAVHRH